MKPPESETATLVEGLGEKLRLHPISPLSNARIPVRLVVCVDGTWGEPDGIHRAFEGNISNIFRVRCTVKEGEVCDSRGTHWRQECKYFKGLNNPNSWHGKLISGAFGTGIEEQIKEVYRYCCEHASHPEDEIYFFGFSRGAFVVRAVANLLMYMRIPGRVGDSASFDDLYRETLALYKDVRQGSGMKKGSIFEYMSKCLVPPTIRFIGVLDTVKAFNDNGLYDISLIDSLHHCRQALALNELKTAFGPEIWSVAENSDEHDLRATSNDHSLLQAWFVGTHGDLGGANAQDGCALYPLQWLLSEASDVGLALSFTAMTRTTTILRNEVALDDPLALVFPRPMGSSKEDGALPHVLALDNGIQVKMWDIRSVHKRRGYNLRINQGRINRWVFSTAPREVFDQDCLMGYHDKASVGVFIHPSAYLIYDLDLHINMNSKDWSFQDEFCNFRHKIISDEKQTFWEHSSGEIDEHIKKVRILVCGNAGVGKSTLINKVLGVPDLTPESKNAHGVHDIGEGFSPEGAQYVIHDSCGFQAGAPKEIDAVKAFLRARSSCAELSERLHVIWYCVPANRLRTTETADAEFFRTLAECDSNVPVIVICTRKDELEALCNAQVQKDYISEHGIQSIRAISPADWDEIDNDVKRTLDQRKVELMDGFAGLHRDFLGPIYISRDDKISIAEVATETSGSLTNDRVRLLFMAAQICTVQPKIDAAITNSLRLYAHAVRTSSIPVAFTGLAATTTVSALICTDILKIFQYSNFSPDIASRTISNAFVRNYEANGIQIAGQALSIAGLGAMSTGVGALPGAAFAVGATVINTIAIPQFGRLLLMCTVDVILIMERVYWQCEGQVTAEDIEKACAWYRHKVGSVQSDVKTLLPVWGIWSAFQYDKLKIGLAKIIDVHRFRKGKWP